ncbi:uncharacterized protein PAC_04079 [Phialocephala subalpina]|uniref:DUF7791 domain-containing protein n=1 Tax=Phialocephala subalpina TaxID=576137 RepID=A0A1L7WN53_9HELO|nr:uncharacterized protein PAC_04079 [Phialocephala subalpina]
MDPLTALGLASNIIQLISFTSDLIAKGREIYRSADGGLIENLELETIAKSLPDLTSNLPLATKEKSYVWKEDAIDALSKRLERYRSQLDTTLLVSLREKLQDEGAVSKFWGTTRRNIAEPKPWQRELLQAVRQNTWESRSQQDIIAFSLRMSAYTKEERERLVKMHILEQLRFAGMGDRYEHIEDAYGKTFNWIFEEGGSVHLNPEVLALASDDWELVMGRGTTSPTSTDKGQGAAESESTIAGCVTETENIPHWSSFINWLLELTLAFETLLSDESQRFFFFIDGLDEFDGDCNEIAKFVLDHSTRSNVKMCVASRPWLVFEDAFQRRPSLRLEDLTIPDIKLFVSEKLRENNMFLVLERLQPQEARNLVVEVTEKASGVFLWVCLVVSSLLEGLRDGDSISDLQERLYLLPSNLEDLFSKILDRLNPSYFKQVSRLFQLVRASDESMSLLTLSFAEDGFDAAMAAEVEPLPMVQLTYRAESMRRRLNSRCKGLLEAPVRKNSILADALVQYLHRTVKDFLNRSDIWEYIVSGGNQPFDPDPSLFGASLLHIKTMQTSAAVLYNFQKLLEPCVKCSVKFENTKPKQHIDSLKELDRAASKLFLQPHPECLALNERNSQLLENIGPPPHWTSRLSKPGSIPLNSFFDYAFKVRLYSFIDHELASGHEVNGLVPWGFWLQAAVVENDIRLIKILFRLGADPNFRRRESLEFTPWMRVLGRIEHPTKTASEDPVADLIEIVSLFLDNNADPRANAAIELRRPLLSRASKIRIQSGQRSFWRN